MLRVCTAFDCLVRTCEFHKCHLKKRIRKFEFIHFNGDCDYYKSRNEWKTYYNPPERDDYLYDDDDEEDVIDE